MVARFPHICNGCTTVIEPKTKYWSNPYKVYCLDCYGREQMLKKNSSHPYQKDMKCYKCGGPSVGYLYDKVVCGEHIGDAFYSVEQSNRDEPDRAGKVGSSDTIDDSGVDIQNATTDVGDKNNNMEETANV